MPKRAPSLFTDPFSSDSAPLPDHTPLIRRIKRRRGLVTAYLSGSSPTKYFRR